MIEHTICIGDIQELLRGPINIHREKALGTQQGWAKIWLSKSKKMILKDVIYAEDFYKSVISVSKLCENGTTITCTQNEAILTSPSGEKVHIPKRQGGVMVYIRDQRPFADTVMTVEDKKLRVMSFDINDAHGLLGHPSEATTNSLQATIRECIREHSLIPKCVVLLHAELAQCALSS